MTFHLFSPWGRHIASQQCRNGGDALSIWHAYPSAGFGILVASCGTPCEVLIR